MPTATNKSSNRFAAILEMALIAGTLDILFACLYSYSKSNLMPGVILQYIAATALGKAAVSSPEMGWIAGLLIHYSIACCWVILYFLAYTVIKRFRSRLLIAAIFYGFFVWCMMNLLLMPLWTGRPVPNLNMHALINILILIIAIGLPSAFGAKKYYDRIRIV